MIGLVSSGGGWETYADDASSSTTTTTTSATVTTATSTATTASTTTAKAVTVGQLTPALASSGAPGEEILTALNDASVPLDTPIGTLPVELLIDIFNRVGPLEVGVLVQLNSYFKMLARDGGVPEGYEVRWAGSSSARDMCTCTRSPS